MADKIPAPKHRTETKSRSKQPAEGIQSMKPSPQEPDRTETKHRPKRPTAGIQPAEFPPQTGRTETIAVKCRNRKKRPHKIAD